MGDEPQDVGGTPCAGYLAESRLKQLLAPMPVMLVRAVPVRASWQAAAVGYLRQDPAIFDTPCYVTTERGATFSFLATLAVRAPEDKDKWTLAGASLILCSDN